MKHLSILFFFAAVLHLTANAQFAPGVEWERCLANATVQSAVSLSDSIFTVAFDLKSCNDSSAVGLRSYGSDGNLLWEKIFTPIINESYRVFSLTKTSDHGYIFAGRKDSSSSDFNWLVKTDSTGNEQWEKQVFFSDSEKTFFGKVVQAANGDFLLTTDQYSSSLRDVHVMRLDANGNVVWEESFGGSLFDYAHDVVATDDGGFLIAAYSNSKDGDFSTNSGLNDIWLLKIDGSGNIQLKKRYGGIFNDQVLSVLKLTDGYLIGGMSESSDGNVTGHHGSNTYYDTWIFKVDVNGTLIWEKSFGGKSDDYTSQMIGLSDGNFLLTGSSYSIDGNVTDHHLNSVYDDQWTIKITAAGSLLWAKSTGGSGDDWSNCIIALDSDNVIIAGASIANDGDHHDVCFTNDCRPIEGGWIVKLNEHCPSYPTPQFSFSQSGKDFSFTNESYNALTYFWNFGDGNTSTEINPSHTYTLNGEYNICLTASDTCSSKTFCTTISTCTSMPVALFNVSYPGGTTIEFTDLSSNAVTWNWDFGDGNSDSTQNPIHTYSLNGEYNVTLTVYDSCNNANSVTQTINTCNGFHPDFSFTISDNTVSFFDNTEGLPASWNWDFGDGDSSQLEDPSHTYASGGVYTVCMTAAAIGCSPQTICKTVSACDPVTIDSFTFTTDTNQVSFFDASQNATAWQWNFGDGNFSSEQNPQHIFMSGGTFTVCEMVSNSCNSDSICEVVSVECDEVQSAFSFAPDTLSVSFTDQSLNSTSWQWDFGDGNFSSQENPTHLYNTAGTYIVCLIAFSPCSSDTLCSTITVSCNPGQAAFSYTTSFLDVSFTDLSDNATSWSWDFGDGNISSQQNPSNTFALSGDYNVCLIVSNECGNDTSCMLIHVDCPPFNAAFSFTPAYLSVSFSDQSLTANQWQWDFGDGNFSSQQNPSHNYSQSGTYHVCLIASDNCSSDTLCEDVTVQCPPFVAAFTFVQANDTVTFTDQSANAIQWQWDFGDGNFSSQQNPSHNYSASGTYHVCLLASDSCSSDTLCEDVIVQCPPFVAAFTFVQSNDTVEFTDQSANAVQWLWDFGDGDFSSVQNPVHIYDSTGAFLVCLIAYDSCSFDTLCDSVQVIPLIVSSSTLENFFFSIFPNPSHADASLTFYVTQSSIVTIILYDVSGKEVRKVFDGEVSEGKHSAVIHSQNLSAGTYFVKLKSEREFVVRKLIME